MRIITLTTDFGTRDGYTGAVKGVILSIAPEVTLVDITHDVPPQNIVHGAWVLARAVPYFPPGSIHVGVVDPGVGGARRGIALATPYAILVGPDNGLFTPFFKDVTACVALTNPALHRHPVSTTFHGRDVFAPVAAHLARGVPLAECGPDVGDPVLLPELQPQRLPGGVLAQVVHIDRFGNLVTNFRSELWLGTGETLNRVRVTAGGVTAPFHATYADAAPGELLALIGSDGYLEIAVRDGSAARRLGLDVGAQVEVQL